jgi:hypothetical protein
MIEREMPRVTGHGFTGLSERCEHLVTAHTMCGLPRAEHAVTAARSSPRYYGARGHWVYRATSSVPGIDVGVDRNGSVVIHTDRRTTYQIKNLDTLIAELEQARRYQKRFAATVEHGEAWMRGEVTHPGEDQEIDEARAADTRRTVRTISSDPELGSQVVVEPPLPPEA